ncbi:hypothetical protein LOSG293_110440 [Secundilactobacillus oryzae JCM 18671]|uniref:Uncharacterized protein n=1 Tax=Secundilactobacillus oryzae JCM 18671 TaxID=1291743 RepID=A0A081BI60_9LACO|nr:hypothetical protein LOSG293_110440 [Secundilactobacillus oryzae JCM 18671]
MEVLRVRLPLVNLPRDRLTNIYSSKVVSIVVYRIRNTVGSTPTGDIDRVRDLVINNSLKKHE